MRYVSIRRQNILVVLLEFSIGSLTFTYIGIPFFKARPKVSYLQSIADQIKAKLAAWTNGKKCHS